MPTPDTEFYVGYLPLPPNLKRRVQQTALVVFALAATAVAAVAILQRSAGRGQWDPYAVDRFEGTISLSPYPTLATDQGPFLIVLEGKFGAREKLASFDGQHVSIDGSRIERDGLKLIELQSIESVKPSIPSRDTPAHAGVPQTFRGEIIDPKCYAGAMKPGEGKAHKACAILCLRGGIPPMFIEQSGKLHLLVSASGAPLAGEALEAVLPFVADQVELDAVLWLTLRVRHSFEWLSAASVGCNGARRAGIKHAR